LQLLFSNRKYYFVTAAESVTALSAVALSCCGYVGSRRYFKYSQITLLQQLALEQLTQQLEINEYLLE
jgi:hypothetical protein